MLISFADGDVCEGKTIKILESENSEALVGIYYIDDMVDNIAWHYSVVPLPRLCKPACPVGRERGKEGDFIFLTDNI